MTDQLRGEQGTTYAFQPSAAQAVPATISGYIFAARAARKVGHEIRLGHDIHIRPTRAVHR